MVDGTARVIHYFNLQFYQLLGDSCFTMMLRSLFVSVVNAAD